MRAPHTIRTLARQLGSYVGVAALGTIFGGSAFLALDLMSPPLATAKLSLRGPYYQTCREALQDGRANIRRGEPGYRPALDADNDGLACEPFQRR